MSIYRITPLKKEIPRKNLNLPKNTKSLQIGLTHNFTTLQLPTHIPKIAFVVVDEYNVVHAD